MKKIIKFSKTYNNVLSIKKDFYDENWQNLNNQVKINKYYKQNPIRISCKNCQKKTLQKFIKNFLIEYYVCSNCSHLNGKYQDTEKFAKKLYFERSGKNYYKNYLNDYNGRVKNIYLPKAEFLKKIIKKKINLLDIGSGGGHFLKALEIKKINAQGFEPSKVLCDLGNIKLKKNKLINSDFNEIYEVVANQSKFNTISLIGVLEHLIDPHLLLKSFKKGKAKFLYISVPLFSLSVFLENSFKNVFPRQLSGGHTHLYTKDSLNKMAKKYNLKIVGEWWFGTDFPDLYRSLINTSTSLKKEIYLKEINNKLFKVINELQAVLDRNKICSEGHMVFKKK